MRASILVAGCLAAAILLVPVDAAFAVAMAEVKDVSVVGHHFATRISSGTRRAEAKSSSTSRFAVLKLALTVPTDDSKLFTSDFVLAYRRADGKDDRANGAAICRARTAELGEEVSCVVGTGGTWVTLGKGKQYVSVAFFVESDVDAIEIYRLGVSSPIAYRLGRDRPVSVFLTTNEDSERLGKVEQVIEAGGYQLVRTSDKLNKSAKGVVIHYASGAEVHAREISQRLMQVTDDVPELKKNVLATTKDIVVWLGH